MAEELLEKPICRACSADVRPGALFCYNCGSSVQAAENAGSNGRTKFKLSEEVAETENENRFGSVAVNEKPIEKPAEDLFALPVGGKIRVQNDDPTGNPPPPQRSAAELRRKNRSREKTKVEIVWEPPQNSVNFLFILASLFLLLLAIGILMAMLYLR